MEDPLQKLGCLQFLTRIKREKGQERKSNIYFVCIPYLNTSVEWRCCKDSWVWSKSDVCNEKRMLFWCTNIIISFHVPNHNLPEKKKVESDLCSCIRPFKPTHKMLNKLWRLKALCHLLIMSRTNQHLPIWRKVAAENFAFACLEATNLFKSEAYQTWSVMMLEYWQNSE